MLLSFPPLKPCGPTYSLPVPPASQRMGVGLGEVDKVANHLPPKVQQALADSAATLAKRMADYPCDGYMGVYPTRTRGVQFVHAPTSAGAPYVTMRVEPSRKPNGKVDIRVDIVEDALLYTQCVGGSPNDCLKVATRAFYKAIGLQPHCSPYK